MRDISALCGEDFKMKYGMIINFQDRFTTFENFAPTDP